MNKSRGKGWWLTGLVLVLVGVVVAQRLLAPPPVSYMTVTVGRQDIREEVLATGSLAGFKQVSVGAQVSGQLKHLAVSLGQSVKQGDLLAEIDPILQQNDLRSAQAGLDNIRAQQKAKQALLRKQQLVLTRQRQLRRNDANATADLETAEADVAQTQAELESLAAQLQQSRIEVDNAKANLAYTRILAPIDGVVIAIVTEEGQTVVSTQSAPTILKLADLDTMTVKAQISEADVIRVQPGQACWFTVLGDPQTRHTSTLRAIEPAPESESEDDSSASSSTSSDSAIYYNALFDVPNPDHKLRVAMTAEVTVVLGESKQVLAVPLSALRGGSQNGRSLVWLVGPDGKPLSQPVTLGRKDDIHVEITDGLKEGVQVILGDDIAATEQAAMAAESQHRGPPPGM